MRMQYMPASLPNKYRQLGMISRLSPTLNKFVARARAWQGKNFYETKQGIKYAIGGYDSSRFPTYVTKTARLDDLKISIDSLKMPPDALRNDKTWTGRSILESPHYRLMHELSSDSLNFSSEYVQLCLAGTLDARRPFRPKLRHLRSVFKERTDAVSRGEPFDIFVFQPEGTATIIIIDGKHRVALAAYLEMVPAIRVNFISREPFQHPFFVGLYGQVLNASPAEYETNQNWIRMMQGSGKLATD